VWPAPADTGSPPSVANWTLSRFPPDWVPQPCIEWDLQRFSSFAAVAGKFQAAGMDAVLTRLGAISTHAGMRYWSVSDHGLEPLIKDAFAVESPASETRRPDFTPTEMQVDRDLFFAEHDNRTSGSVFYQLRVIERSADRLVVEIANTNKIRLSLLTLFEPGDLRTLLFISRSAKGEWACYALSGSRPTALAGLLDHHKSVVNRLIALYGHLAGTGDDVLPWLK
jgi:hypothetical protein